MSSRRKLLFEYPALPKYEIRFYILVVVVAFVYAWDRVVKATTAYERKIDRLSGLSIPKNNLPIFGPRYKDESNWEWGRWCPFALSFLPYLIMHSIIFNVGEKFISRTIMPHILTAYSICVCCKLFSPWLVSISLIQGTFIFIVAYFLRRRLAVWISAIPILYYVMHKTNEIYHDPFLVLILISYNLLSYISFNLELVENNSRNEDNAILKKYFRMLFYTFYAPYLISLVVTYTEFERQIHEREKRERQWFWVIFFSLRITIYWTAVELMLHLFYFEAMLNDPEFAYGLPKDQFLSSGMAFGQFFHLKYVVIFGMPASFARIDNMQPPKGPVCMARVALYSKMWRKFDRGLYSFFKQYIFIPICAPTFSLPRKMFAVLVCYGFVLVWHGFYYHNYIWIALNIVELFLEYLGKGIYAIDYVRKWRESHIDDVPFRRIVAVLQMITLIPAIYGNYFFVCGPYIAHAVIQRIWVEESITFRYPLFILLALGYIYVQIVLEIERQVSLCHKRTDEAKRNQNEVIGDDEQIAKKEN
uniref:Protein-cysteine N-palmitoyltransferase Rasp n=1 Tax=Parascaris univalens TaxID=6257 RepID=A0A915A7K5_PARUN